MQVKGIEFENWSHYKECAMFIACPYCSFKCDNECGMSVCQNSKLALEPIVEIDIDKLAQSYCKTSISKAIVFAGLEPFDSPSELLFAINIFRKYTNDPIIIYTGYTKEELLQQNSHSANVLRNFSYNCILQINNIIIKYGRFIPNKNSKYDKNLGVTLASENQYSEIYNIK